MPTLVVERTDEPRSWDSKYGTMYSYHVHGALDGNLATGEMTTNNLDRIAKAGDSFEVTVETGKYGLKFKKVQNFGAKPGFKGNSGSENKNPSMAMSYTKDLIVAGKIDFKDWLEEATKAYEWLESRQGTKPEQPQLLPLPVTPPDKKTQESPYDEDPFAGLV